MYSAICFEIYYCIPDAYDLSTDLLQVHIRALLKLLNSFAHKLLVSRCVSSALDLFIFNKIGFFERDRGGRNAMKIPFIHKYFSHTMFSKL